MVYHHKWSKCTLDAYKNNALSESGSGRDMRGTWWLGGEISAGVPSLTELQVKIDCDLMRKRGKTARIWLAGNLRTRASLFLIGRNKIGEVTSTWLQYKEREKGYRKSTPAREHKVQLS